jgi:hypothetical protein
MPPRFPKLLTAKEGENVEFKKTERNYDYEKLVKHACAVSIVAAAKIIILIYKCLA